MDKIRIGLYGANGHQIHRALVDHPLGACVATAAFDRDRLPEPLQTDAGIRDYATLDELLGHDGVDMISLCSPRRRDQAQEAIRCMEAGKHVLAEKPAAMTEVELDAIIDTSRATGMAFHEMWSGSASTQPYWAMRQVVQAGTLGKVIQVLVQKSYPLHHNRPQDEDVDGGLILQVGVHALRFIEFTAGVKVDAIWAIDTQLGNPGEGELRVAASMMLRLANGGVASVACNYLNPPGFGMHGNEMVRIFGTEGFLESTDGGTRTRLVLNDDDRGPLAITEPGPEWLDLTLASILGQSSMPIPLEDELHPTRLLIRARSDALVRG
ncbi:MAG: Gfo/Idh/MocA family oxidoreductase [Anaerolineae bacterium]|jgi:predicted dehydrogenase|nr:Gfo/Idh/MocA family oxidoreductase [Anaerolineae bacterium]